MKAVDQHAAKLNLSEAEDPLLHLLRAAASQIKHSTVWVSVVRAVWWWRLGLSSWAREAWLAGLCQNHG